MVRGRLDALPEANGSTLGATSPASCKAAPKEELNRLHEISGQERNQEGINPVILPDIVLSGLINIRQVCSPAEEVFGSISGGDAECDPAGDGPEVVDGVQPKTAPGEVSDPGQQFALAPGMGVFDGNAETSVSRTDQDHGTTIENGELSRAPQRSGGEWTSHRPPPASPELQSSPASPARTGMPSDVTVAMTDWSPGTERSFVATGAAGSSYLFATNVLCPGPAVAEALASEAVPDVSSKGTSSAELCRAPDGPSFENWVAGTERPTNRLPRSAVEGELNSGPAKSLHVRCGDPSYAMPIKRQSTGSGHHDDSENADVNPDDLGTQKNEWSGQPPLTGSSATPQTAASLLQVSSAPEAPRGTAAEPEHRSSRGDPPLSVDVAQDANSTPKEMPVPPIVTGHVLQKMGQTEMRVGLRTEAFGTIELRTTVAQDRVGATITGGHDRLHAAMVAEMPSLQDSLLRHQLRLDALHFSAATGGHGDHNFHQRPSPAPYPQPFARKEPYPEMTIPPASVAAVATASRSTTLSVLA